MRVLGLDLSSKSTGAAILEDGQLITYTTITATSTDPVQRILKIAKKLREFIDNNTPIDRVILEEVRPDIQGRNMQTYKVLMWIQAAVVFMLHECGNPPIEYIYPSSWRSKLGIKQGRGVKRTTLKEEDILFVKNHFNITTNDDAADAICIGLSYFKNNEHKYAW